jgi:hypothetical protein
MYARVAFLLVWLGSAALGQAGADGFFDEKSHDFGPSPRGPQLIHHFRFTNNGKEPLVIARIRATCTCLTATAPSEKIKPGESAAVTVQMDTRRFAGPKSETIYVAFSAPQAEEVALKVRGEVREEFSMTPDKFSFGKVGKGSTSSATIRATLAGDPNWEIAEAKAESTHVKVAAKKVMTKGTMVTYEITATLDDSLPPGRWESEVWLKTSNAALNKVRIPVLVEVVAAVCASPSSVDFGDVKIGASAEQNVILRGEKPFRIKTVKGADSGIEVAGAGAEAKAVHILRFTFKPQKAGDVKQAIEIFGEEGGSSVTVPVTGKGIGE